MDTPHSSSLTPTQLRRLAAYLPVTLARRVLDEGLPEPGIPRQVVAVALFTDISGFTAMSEELAADGPRGAEELNRVLLMTFTAMIDVIHQMGGAVSHFYGDAMSVYFPDEEGLAANRALACAQMMQRLMLTSFSRVVTNRPPGKQPFFELTIKIGVGYGLCQELVVGRPARSLEFVLTGTAVDEAAAAEKQAKSGQVIASRAVLVQAGLPAAADFVPIQTEDWTLPPATPILRWSHIAPDDHPRLAAVAPAFVHQALARRLLTSGADNLAEHRPVSSLFVQFDFVGDEDESSAINTAVMGQQLQAYYEWACGVVARFGVENGRVNRVLTGDKGNQLHIMFGAPVAPDGPDQAMRCALALQREKPAFIARQRMGLAVGKVFAGPVGSAARQEYTVVGDVVNLSARLMQICGDGQVFTDEATAARLRQWFEFDTLPVVRLKGKQIAITPHVPTGERATATQLQAFINRWERPLVGRETELAQLQTAMNRALAGQGGVAALSGATGVGKSRLTAVAAQHWLAAGGLGLLGVSYPHTADTPYSLWRGVWQAFLGLTPGMDTAGQIATVIERTQALLPDVGDDVGLWGEALGLPMPPSAALVALTAEARQARLFALVRRCFRAQAQQRPLLLVLEGLHWADQASLALLDDLTMHIENAPIFLVITFRADAHLTLSTLARPCCTPVALSELTPLPARQLLAQLVGVTELPATVEQHLGLRDRDGRDSPVNPLFLEEAVRMLQGIGVLRQDGQVRVNEALLAQVQVPDTIHGLLLARLDRLPVAERDLLQVASVIGRQFAAEPLTVLSAEPSPQVVVEMLANLSTAEMTRLVEADPAWIYLFQHAMTHEVAYESLPFGRRQMLHALVADWLIEAHADNLPPIYPALAYHYGRAANDEKGLQYALKAAHAARDIFANQEAVDLYTQAERHLQALGEAGWWRTAVDLYLSRANVLILLSDFNGAFEDAAKVLALAEAYDVPIPLATAHNLMAEIAYRQGDFDKVQSLSNKVITLLEGKQTAVGQLARAYVLAGWAASSQLRYDEALAHLHKAQEICIEHDDSFRLATTLEAMAFAYYGQRRLDQALASMQESVRLSRNFSTPVNIGFALNNIAFVAFEAGMPLQALEVFAEAVTLGRDTSRNLLAIALYNRAAVHAYIGNFSEALADFQEAASLLEPEQHMRQLLEMNLYWGIDYCIALGLWQEARDHLDQVEKLISMRPESFYEEQARLHIGLGQIALHTGDFELAQIHFERANELIELKALVWWQPAIHYFIGLVAVQKNDPAQAVVQFQAGLAAIEAGGTPDYKSLLLLEWAQMESSIEKTWQLLKESLHFAEQRARFVDRLHCFRVACQLLVDAYDGELQELARYCQRKLAEMEPGT
ncbi:MAG: adenylyl cyclase [Chloroflexota bacterium]|nr:MAG: adenylyl cyclase [Chloroflexota bacterium]